MTYNRTTERVDHPPRVREAIDELMREKDAADNRATELTATERLRAMLDERGVDWIADDSDVLLVTRWKTENSKTAMYMEPVGECCEGWNNDFSFYATPEQAIAATLGSGEPPYDELLRCLERDWNISASWDGLRKFWCVELTEEGVKLRDATHSTLTAEQVEIAVNNHCQFTVGCVVDAQAIADELNARAERTCRIVEYDEAPFPVCSECGAVQPDDYAVYYCWSCGAKVRNE